MVWEEGGEQDPKILISKRVNILSSSKGRYPDTATTLSSFVGDLLRAIQFLFSIRSQGDNSTL